MMTQDSLTTEQIRKNFKNNFDLCNFAITIARNMITSSQTPTLSDILIQATDRGAAGETFVAPKSRQ